MMRKVLGTILCMIALAAIFTPLLVYQRTGDFSFDWLVFVTAAVVLSSMVIIQIFRRPDKDEDEG